MTKIMIDAGHGGADPGAVYNGRQEKDDNLNLALAVGRILEEDGYEVEYTRTKDLYQTPYEKAELGNGSGADLFVSIHRNSSVFPDQYSGVETLVFDNSGQKARAAANINERLEQLGFRNIGVIERPNLVVLNSTDIPALLVEAGFINNSEDNRLFDQQFDAIARAIAKGIEERLTSGEAGGVLPGADRYVQKPGQRGTDAVPAAGGWISGVSHVPGRPVPGTGGRFPGTGKCRADGAAAQTEGL